MGCGASAKYQAQPADQLHPGQKSRLSEDDIIKKADKVFLASDRDGDWALCHGELAAIVKVRGDPARPGATQQEIDKANKSVQTILDEMDQNKDNRIEAAEWHAWIKVLLEVSGPQHVENVLLSYQDRLCTKKADFVFYRIDDDANMGLTEEELRSLITPGEGATTKADAAQVEAMIKKIDMSTGHLTQKEWNNYIEELKTAEGTENLFNLLEKFELAALLKKGDILHKQADENGDRKLTKGELSKMLKQRTRADLATSMLADLDKDQNGSLDENEFRSWITDVYNTQGANSTWKVIGECNSRIAASKDGQTDAANYRRPIVGANWKCNPAGKGALADLMKNISDCDTSRCDVYLCPSSLHVASCKEMMTAGEMYGVRLAPQTCNFKGCGAFTGEMAVEQMKDMGITDVLIGHSERRGSFELRPTDDNDTLAAKLKYALDAGMSCCFCVGEPLKIRQQGISAVLQEIDAQLSKIYKLLDPAKVVIAYEPVWAINTGESATAEVAQATHAGIRKLIADLASESVAAAIRIQYGGSCNGSNAAELAAQPDIDGFLVGGASLKPEFKDMVDALAAAKKSRRPIIGANWKCNPASREELENLIKNINACDTSGCDVYVCPSSLHVDYCCQAGKFTNAAIVTPQSCNFKGCGAFTGEMAVEQMKDLGINNVLIGHSERRGAFEFCPTDNNDNLAAKLKYVLDAGLNCIYCIGEPLEIREKGLDAVLQELHVQLGQIYKLLHPAKVVLAYEPVWAIGSGKSATAADAQATHAGIRKLISEHAPPGVAAKIRIQYGGSSNGANAAELSAQPDIDGFLVGGASLKPEFKDMVAAISTARPVPFNRTQT